MAPPGSGKTRVLQERAAHLLTQDRTGGRVIGVTFTQDAAKELEGRIRRQMGDVGDRLLCGTFHSLAKRQIEEAGFKVRLVKDTQQFDFMQRALRMVTDSKVIHLEDVVRYIEGIKGSVTPAVPGNGAAEKEVVLHSVYEQYEVILESMGLMDFGDLMAKAVRGMLGGIEYNGKRIPVAPLRGFHLMIDEMQDTDALQLEWIRCHLRSGMKITAVGDDDQSLYPWRGGLGFDGMKQLIRDARADTTVLNVSYRCAQDIMASAVKLIEHNKDRQPKETRSNNTNRGIIKTEAEALRSSEILKMASTIRASGDIGSWAVLARNNRLLENVEEIFSRPDVQIKTIRRGGKGFWEGPMQQLYLGLLRSMVNGQMTGVDGALRLMGTGTSTLESLHMRFRSRDEGAARRFLEADDLEGQPALLQKAMKGWMRELKAGKVDFVCMDAGEFLCTHGVFPKKKTKAADGTEKDAAESKRKIIRVAAKSVGGRRGTLAVRLMGIEDSDDKKGLDEDGEPVQAVTLMTLHGSKGLEFKNVWMMGCEEGVIPSKRSTDHEEERRLFYVGMTRAINQLVISMAQKDDMNERPKKADGTKGDEKKKEAPEGARADWSRFLEEAGVQKAEVQERLDAMSAEQSARASAFA